jgi:hypothetical protein
MSPSFEPEHGFFATRRGPDATDGRDRTFVPNYSYGMGRDFRRPDGIASTIKQSPIITIPINSKAKAFMAILPNMRIELGERVDRLLIQGTWGRRACADGGRELKEFG